MRSDFLECLRFRPLISDGATGTMLQRMGLPAGESPVACNLSHPDWVKSLHQKYVDAGCNVILTNTFGGSRPTLEREGHADNLRELNVRGAAIARDVAQGNPSRDVYVAASIGPTGLFLEPFGDVGEAQLEDVFGEQVEALLGAGVDLFCIETMSDLGEVKAAMRSVRCACDLPIVATLTFDPGQRGLRTMTGVTPAMAVDDLVRAGADVVGTNCGSGIDEVISVIREMRSANSSILLAAKPNAGLPELLDGRTVYRTAPDVMADGARRLAETGASLIGGCCGTTPEHLSRMADEIRRYL